MRGPALSTTYVSGSTAPDTTASPRPKAASMTIVERFAVDGSAVNMTPERSESTISWTITAIAGSPVSSRLAR